MPSINSVTLLGHLARDADHKFTPSGKSVTKFTVATEERWKDAAGEEKKKVSYPSVVAWGLDDSTVAMLKKGALVLVVGSIETGSYEKDGRKVYTSDVNARVVQYCRDANQSGAPQRRAEAQEEVPW